jgi:hypothetical protein
MDVSTDHRKRKRRSADETRIAKQCSQFCHRVGIDVRLFNRWKSVCAKDLLLEEPIDEWLSLSPSASSSAVVDREQQVTDWFQHMQQRANSHYPHMKLAQFVTKWIEGVYAGREWVALRSSRYIQITDQPSMHREYLVLKRQFESIRPPDTVIRVITCKPIGSSLTPSTTYEDYYWRAYRDLPCLLTMVHYTVSELKPPNKPQLPETYFWFQAKFNYQKYTQTATCQRMDESHRAVYCHASTVGQLIGSPRVNEKLGRSIATWTFPPMEMIDGQAQPCSFVTSHSNIAPSGIPSDVGTEQVGEHLTEMTSSPRVCDWSAEMRVENGYPDINLRDTDPSTCYEQWTSNPIAASYFAPPASLRLSIGLEPHQPTRGMGNTFKDGWDVRFTRDACIWWEIAPSSSTLTRPIGDLLFQFALPIRDLIKDVLDSLTLSDFYLDRAWLFRY